MVSFLAALYVFVSPASSFAFEQDVQKMKCIVDDSTTPPSWPADRVELDLEIPKVTYFMQVPAGDGSFYESPEVLLNADVPKKISKCNPEVNRTDEFYIFQYKCPSGFSGILKVDFVSGTGLSLNIFTFKEDQVERRYPLSKCVQM